MDLLDSDFAGSTVTTPRRTRRARLSVDEQICHAAEQHQAYRAEDFARNTEAAKAVMPWRKIPSQPEVGCFDVFCLDQDPQYLELVARGDEEDEKEIDDLHMAKWRNDCRQKIRMLLMDLRMTEDVRLSETRLRCIYEWYDQQRTAWGEKSILWPPSSLEHDVLGPGRPKVETPHIHPLVAETQIMPPAPLTTWTPVLGQDQSDPVQQQHHQHHQHHLPYKMPPASERLKQFKTHQIVGPLTAQKLRAERSRPSSACNSSCERSVTPSTSAGGLTARSFGSTITSARSSPTPAEIACASRPSSASAWSVRSARKSATSRPHSALAAFRHRPVVNEERLAELAAGLPRSQPGMQAAPAHKLQPDATEAEAHEVSTEDAELAAQAARAAQTKMAERWLAHRNRDLAQQIIQEQRNTAVSEWSERRARVEEEIARNAEVARFQSELVRRDWVPPPGAKTYIAPSVSALATCDELGRMPSQGASSAVVDALPQDESEDSVAPEESSEGSASCTDSKSSQGSQTRPESAGSQGSRKSPRVTFPPDVNLADSKAATASSQKPPLNAKIAHLRRLHSKLLQAIQDEPQDKHNSSASEGSVASRGCQGKISEENASHAPLSTHTCGRMPDDTDVLAALCPSWQGGLIDEDILTHGQIREQQRQEVQAVLSAFRRRRQYIDPLILESALVSLDRELPGDAQPLYVKRIMQRTPFDQVRHPSARQTTTPQRQGSRGSGRRVSTARGQSARSRAAQSPTARSSNAGIPTARPQTASSPKRKQVVATGGRRRAASARR